MQGLCVFCAPFYLMDIFLGLIEMTGHSKRHCIKCTKRAYPGSDSFVSWKALLTWTRISKKLSKMLVKLRPVFELEEIWNGCRYLEVLFLLWKFRIFVAIWSWFQSYNLFGLEMRAVWKKMTKKLVFWDQEKGPLFSNFEHFAKMPDFVRL